MSRPTNSMRLNLSFKSSSESQTRAYEILKKVENKTEYITGLILSSIQQGEAVPDNRAAAPHLSREELKAAIIEAIRENPEIAAGIRIEPADKKNHEPPESTARDEDDGCEVVEDVSQSSDLKDEFDVVVDDLTMQGLKSFGFDAD